MKTIKQKRNPKNLLCSHCCLVTMGLTYPIKEHVGKGMMVQTLQDGILKLNHLLFDELFKGKKTCPCWGR